MSKEISELVSMVESLVELAFGDQESPQEIDKAYPAGSCASVVAASAIRMIEKYKPKEPPVDQP